MSSRPSFVISSMENAHETKPFGDSTVDAWHVMAPLDDVSTSLASRN